MEQSSLPLGLASTEGLGSTAAEAMERGAIISACERYRYSLWRKWGSGGTVMFVGLNPSSADATLDDPTIRRCVAFARSWGFGGLMMTNLFAFRATLPSTMKARIDAVGPDNDLTLSTGYMNAALTVAAWGAHGTHQGRDARVRAMLPRLHYLRLTKDGHPGHPLYLPASLRPVEWVNSCLPNVRGEAGPTVGRQARRKDDRPPLEPGLVARRWASPRPRG